MRASLNEQLSLFYRDEAEATDVELLFLVVVCIVHNLNFSAKIQQEGEK